MKVVWFLALVACVGFTALFYWTLAYYFLYYHVTWRVVALLSVVAFWTLLTRLAFVKFVGRKSN